MQARTIAIAAAALMVACAIASQVLRPRPAPDVGLNLSQAIPEQFAGWRIDPSVIPIAPSPDVQANLEQIYDQMVSRTYINEKGERIMLVIAYGGDQSDSLKAHRQEVCYAAQGFAIRSVRKDQLAVGAETVPMVRVHAQKGRRSEPVTYWFTMGDNIVIGRADRLVAQIGYGLRGRVPDGMLVRVSNVSGDVKASYTAHDEFLRALIESLDPRMRQRLAGLSDGAPAASAS